MHDILTPVASVVNAGSLGSLLPAFKVVQQMTDTYEHIKFAQKRCKDIIQRAALIIKGVHGYARHEQSNVAELQEKLEDIQTILQRLASMSFFQALLRFENITKDIERANRQLADCSKLFPMTHLPSHVEAQEKAAMLDRDALRALLKILVGNYEEIRRHLGIYSDEQEDQAMAAMERELRDTGMTSEEDMPVEMQIMQKSLECIRSTTGKSAPRRQKWLITEYDLDYCGTIGGGGFATVFMARFRGTIVAVKTLKGVGNMREALEREAEIWSTLRHDHVVPFYGASILTSPPFIVSRYMQKGNLVQYLAATPKADRTKLIFEVSLGMYYLHEEYVVHGDLKGVNVLVDDSGKACITDFGLSKVYSSEATGTRTDQIKGTLRFLAPEALRGEPLSFETDVYAFGMLIYEVFTGEVPFSREPDEVVKEGLVELHRPTWSETFERGFDDAVWQLLSDCISREPSSRPHFKTIQAILRSSKKAGPSVSSARLGIKNENLTDWGLTMPSIDRAPLRQWHLGGTPLSEGTTPTDVNILGPGWVEPSAQLIHPGTTYSPSILNNSTPFPHQRRKTVPVRQPSPSHDRTIPHHIKTSPPPMCIVVTHKYINVPFGISSRKPSVCLEKANTFKWQSITPDGGTLLSEQGDRFVYRNGSGIGKTSWEVSGNDVTIRTASLNGICHFKDPRTAENWFKLQLSYVRNGFVHDCETVVGDWSRTEQSWRRLAHGKIQGAALVEGNSRTVPTDRAWSDVSLPTCCTIENTATTEHCVVCTIDPGKQPRRLLCKLEGSKIVVEAHRREGNKESVTAREETYPSKEYTEMMFRVLRTALEKVAKKNNRSFSLSR